MEELKCRRPQISRTHIHKATSRRMLFVWGRKEASTCDFQSPEVDGTLFYHFMPHSTEARSLPEPQASCFSIGLIATKPQGPKDTVLHALPPQCWVIGVCPHSTTLMGCGDPKHKALRLGASNFNHQATSPVQLKKKSCVCVCGGEILFESKILVII